MMEVFIPIDLKYDNDKTFAINNFSKKNKDLLEKNFDLVSKKEFNSTFFDWIFLQTKELDEDLVVFLNWVFGNFYFLDYDYFSFSLESFGTKILKIDETLNKIPEITQIFENIIWDLQSEKLLTNTKKETMKNDIRKAFLTLSGVFFVLYNLREKTIENLWELQNYNWEVEYEAEASLLSETWKTKKIELDATISSLENKLKLFLEVVGKIFL